MSLNKRLCHPESSQQQMVVATDDNHFRTVWLVERGLGNEGAANGEVKRGEVLRLKHVETGMYLHSHGDRKAPIDKTQQEITAWNSGDANDDWLLEPRAGDYWLFDEPFRLVHRNTKKNLHSHSTVDPVFTAGFQEVTGFGHRDDNDLWVCRLLDQPENPGLAPVEDQPQNAAPANVDAAQMYVEPMLEISQAAFPLAEIDFERLQGPNSKFSTVAGAIVLASFGALINPAAKYLQNTFSANAVSIEKWEWVAPTIFLAVGGVCYLVGCFFPTPKKQTLDRIKKHFHDPPRRHSVGDRRRNEGR